MKSPNVPYVKQYDKKGFLVNPIKDFYLTKEPTLTRRARRQAGKFKLPIKSHQAIPLFNTKIDKYTGKKIKVFNGKYKHITHYETPH